MAAVYSQRLVLRVTRQGCDEKDALRMLPLPFFRAPTAAASKTRSGDEAGVFESGGETGDGQEEEPGSR